MVDHLTYYKLQQRPDLLSFLRYNPEWYRYLTRNPDQLVQMEKEAKIFHGKTLTQRIEKFNDHLELATMLIYMTETFKD